MILKKIKNFIKSALLFSFYLTTGIELSVTHLVETFIIFSFPQIRASLPYLLFKYYIRFFFLFLLFIFIYLNFYISPDFFFTIELLGVVINRSTKKYVKTKTFYLKFSMVSNSLIDLQTIKNQLSDKFKHQCTFDVFEEIQSQNVILHIIISLPIPVRIQLSLLVLDFQGLEITGVYTRSYSRIAQLNKITKIQNIAVLESSLLDPKKSLNSEGATAFNKRIEATSLDVTYENIPLDYALTQEFHGEIFFKFFQLVKYIDDMNYVFIVEKQENGRAKVKVFVEYPRVVYLKTGALGLFLNNTQYPAIYYSSKSKNSLTKKAEKFIFGRAFDLMRSNLTRFRNEEEGTAFESSDCNEISSFNIFSLRYMCLPFVCNDDLSKIFEQVQSLLVPGENPYFKMWIEYYPPYGVVFRGFFWDYAIPKDLHISIYDRAYLGDCKILNQEIPFDWGNMPSGEIMVLREYGYEDRHTFNHVCKSGEKSYFNKEEYSWSDDDFFYNLELNEREKKRKKEECTAFESSDCNEISSFNIFSLRYMCLPFGRNDDLSKIFEQVQSLLVPGENPYFKMWIEYYPPYGVVFRGFFWDYAIPKDLYISIYDRAYLGDCKILNQELPFDWGNMPSGEIIVLREYGYEDRHNFNYVCESDEKSYFNKEE